MSIKNFDQSRERLAAALNNLEEIVTKKIREAVVNSHMLDASDASHESTQSKVIEQAHSLQNLSEELNKMQKIISESGKENDFLKDKNRFFADKIFKFKTQGSSLIQAVESDLVRIKEIIKNQ